MVQVTFSSWDHLSPDLFVSCQFTPHPPLYHHPPFLKIFPDSFLLSASITGPWRDLGEGWPRAQQGPEPNLVCPGCQFLYLLGMARNGRRPNFKDPATRVGVKVEEVGNGLHM